MPLPPREWTEWRKVWKLIRGCSKSIATRRGDSGPAAEAKAAGIEGVSEPLHEGTILARGSKETMMKMTRLWTATLLFFVAISLGTAGGQASRHVESQDQGFRVKDGTSESRTSSATDPSFQQRYPRYKLQPGDSFEVYFELSPEFNQTSTVQPDGFITLRGIGDIHVADRTVPELTETLLTAYSQILHDPQINVVLKDFEKPYFMADGQVGRPGKYDLRGDTTLTQAIAMAGGFLDSAKHSQVLLFRRASEGWFSAQIFDIKKMEKDGDLHEDPHLHPGDMLFVPKNRFSKIRPFIPGASLGTMFKPY